MDISETILSKEEQEDEDLIMIAGDEPLSSLDNISCSNLNKVWVNPNPFSASFSYIYKQTPTSQPRSKNSSNSSSDQPSEINNPNPKSSFEDVGFDAERTLQETKATSWRDLTRSIARIICIY
jgi:hypothetical protein